jgi:hypothetical protein
MSDESEPGPAARAAGRRSWPVSVHRLGEGPGDDLTGSTTAAERLAMMWPLAVDAWALAGRAIPTYAREAAPVSIRPLVGGPRRR